jgi:hypothetical protein
MVIPMSVSLVVGLGLMPTTVLSLKKDMLKEEHYVVVLMLDVTPPKIESSHGIYSLINILP